MRWCLAILIFGSSCVEPYTSQESEGPVIGMLLPFTGDVAATGTNLEKAALLAARAVNEAGGIAGEPITAQAVDTHSDIGRGMHALQQLLDTPDLVALLGPESPDEATGLASMIRGSGLLHVQPGVISPPLDDGGSAETEFRLAPTAESVGCSLANRLASGGAGDIVVLRSEDSYHVAVASAFVREYATSQGLVVPVIRLDRNDLETSIQEVIARDPEHIVLLAFPATAALFVQELIPIDSGALRQWLLSPALNNGTFLVNLPPGALEGAVGISSAPPFGTIAEFEALFREAWVGDSPLVGAYYYYDAVALVALALQAAAFSGSDAVASLSTHLLEVSRPPGKLVFWHDLGAGLRLLENGEQIDYQGVSGPVDLSDSGDIAQSILQFWRIQDGEVSPTSLSSYRCSSP